MYPHIHPGKIKKSSSFNVYSTHHLIHPLDFEKEKKLYTSLLFVFFIIGRSNITKKYWLIPFTAIVNTWQHV